MIIGDHSLGDGDWFTNILSTVNTGINTGLEAIFGVSKARAESAAQADIARATMQEQQYVTQRWTSTITIVAGLGFAGLLAYILFARRKS